MKLSPHFTLEELTISQKAARMGWDNQPDASSLAALQVLCETVLEPLRAAFGLPIVVNSGYRTPRVNASVGGSKNSQHMRGQAADIIIPGVAIGVIVAKVAELKLPFDQCIDEYSAWVHISHVPSGPNRRHFLTARRVNGKAIYRGA